MCLSRLILMDCRLSAVQTCRQSAESRQQWPSTVSDDLVTNFLLPLDSWPFCRWAPSLILAPTLCVVSLSHGLSFKESHENIQWVCDVTFECGRRAALRNRNTWRIRNSLVTVTRRPAESLCPRLKTTGGCKTLDFQAYCSSSIEF